MVWQFAVKRWNKFFLIFCQVQKGCFTAVHFLLLLLTCILSLLWYTIMNEKIKSAVFQHWPVAPLLTITYVVNNIIAMFKELTKVRDFLLNKTEHLGLGINQSQYSFVRTFRRFCIMQGTHLVLILVLLTSSAVLDSLWVFLVLLRMRLNLDFFLVLG